MAQIDFMVNIDQAMLLQFVILKIYLNVLLF